jgi:hypothetical protein
VPRPVWVAHSSFIEGSHMTKNTAPANIRLELKCLSATNTLAYYGTEITKGLKSFIKTGSMLDWLFVLTVFYFSNSQLKLCGCSKKKTPSYLTCSFQKPEKCIQHILALSGARTLSWTILSITVTSSEGRIPVFCIDKPLTLSITRFSITINETRHSNWHSKPSAILLNAIYSECHLYWM